MFVSAVKGSLSPVGQPTMYRLVSVTWYALVIRFYVAKHADDTELLAFLPGTKQGVWH